MMIIGCDLHTRYQQIAMLDTETGELVERRLEHESGEARAFYTALSGRVAQVSAGIPCLAKAARHGAPPFTIHLHPPNK